MTEAVSLSVIPLLNALALKVIVPPLVTMGEEYILDRGEGSEPSVVYLIVAPAVMQRIVTFCDEEYVPPRGLNVGVAT